MFKTRQAALAVALTLACAAVAAAAETAGMVKTSQGQVGLERGGQKLLAVVGTPLLVNDRLRTGGNGTVGVTLRDGTLLSAGPNSVILVDKFAYDGTTHDGVTSVGILRGTLAVVTGRIAGKKPEAVEFHTPTSVLGVRGTEFVVEVEGAHAD